MPVPNYKKLSPFLISCAYLELDFDPDPALYWSVRLMKLVGGFSFTSSLACKFTLKQTCLHFQKSNFSHYCYHCCALMRKNLQASSHQNHHCFLQKRNQILLLLLHTTAPAQPFSSQQSSYTFIYDQAPVIFF